MEAGVFAHSPRRPAGGGATAPRPAAEHALLAVGRPARVGPRAGAVVVLGVDVVAPLGHVPVHVVQAPGVGLLQPALAGVRLALLVVDHVSVPPAVVADLLWIVAIAELRLASGAAGVFPLGLGRKGYRLADLPGKLAAELRRFIRVNPTRRVVRTDLRQHLAVIRLGVHDRCPLGLGDLVNSHVERLGDLHFVAGMLAGVVRLFPTVKLGGPGGS